MEVDDPNKRLDSVDLGAWMSTSDIDTFLSRFNHANNYDDGTTKLHVGDYIRIGYDNGNRYWKIAGFDLESDRIASDGTTYDNGYGIMLYPMQIIFSASINSTNTISGGFINTEAHNTNIPIIINNMTDVLDTHIVNRNVLLSSSVNSSGSSDAYTWTTAYGTLPSICQIIGDFGNIIYNNGEANYKLPLFNYHRFWYGKISYWVRDIRFLVSGKYQMYSMNQVDIDSDNVTSSLGYCPMIYLR